MRSKPLPKAEAIPRLKEFFEAGRVCLPPNAWMRALEEAISSVAAGYPLQIDQRLRRGPGFGGSCQCRLCRQRGQEGKQERGPVDDEK